MEELDILQRKWKIVQPVPCAVTVLLRLAGLGIPTVPSSLSAKDQAASRMTMAVPLSAPADSSWIRRSGPSNHTGPCPYNKRH